MTAPLLTPRQCADVIEMFDDARGSAGTVVMARHAYGEGRYRYFGDPLPSVVQALREQLYPPMAAIANRWTERLGERRFPASLGPARGVRGPGAAPADSPAAALRAGRLQRLHQDVYGDLTFPLQFLVMLSRPDEDFTGGESVFVEQRPRQQSRAMVARPELGEAVIFSVRGARGYRRVQLRHGASAVHSGSRQVLGIIFHNAR
jgi:uncharacterized protein